MCGLHKGNMGVITTPGYLTSKGKQLSNYPGPKVFKDSK